MRKNSAEPRRQKARSTPRDQRPVFDGDELERLYQQAMANGVQGDASALAELVTLSRRKLGREALLDPGKHASLRSLLASQSPKVRKNTARLLGELGQKGDARALLAALESEKTLFVLPSIILALGNCGGEEAFERIQLLKTEWEQREASPDENKHREEILSAATKALLSREDGRIIECTGLPDLNWHLIPPGGGLPLLMQEAEEKAISGRSVLGGLSIRNTSYEQLLSLRCFEEALLPIAAAPLPPQKEERDHLAMWADDVRKVAEPFVSLLAARYQPAPIPYRIELRNLPHEQRGTLARALSKALDADGRLQNRPSAYVAELRLERFDSRMQLFGKLFLPPDTRFEYRKESLPASIAPATAACLLRFARPHMKDGARVVDPCCGSGTLLVERARLLSVSDSLGIDNANQAVSAARKNIRAAGVGESIEVVAGDLRRFNARQRFDELVANLPFGVRVGDGDDADRLYESLFSRLDEWLLPDGFALLYSTRKQVVDRLCARSRWKIREQMRFEAGGLSPWALLLKREGRV